MDTAMYESKLSFLILCFQDLPAAFHGVRTVTGLLAKEEFPRAL